MPLVNEILSSHRFFEGIDPAYLRILRDCAETCDFENGRIICRQGEEARRFFVIHRGRVSLELHTADRGVVTIETLGNGDILGSSWLFPPYRHQWDARSMEHTRTVAFNADCLRGTCEADHDLGYELMKRFAGIMINRLQAARIQCLDIYGTPTGPAARRKPRT